MKKTIAVETTGSDEAGRPGATQISIPVKWGVLGAFFAARWTKPGSLSPGFLGGSFRRGGPGASSRGRTAYNVRDNLFREDGCFFGHVGGCRGPFL